MPDICDYENSTYRTEFWENRGRDYEDRTERIAVKGLLPRGERLLELGAGFGRMADLYKDYKKIVLVDFSHSQLEYARDHYGPDKFIYVAADIYHLPFAPAQFDTITMVRTLHHMDDPLSALKQVRASIRSGGNFILEFTSKRNLRSIARWSLRHWQKSKVAMSNPFSKEPVKFYDLYYGFHPSFVHDLLIQAHFAPGRRKAVSYFRLNSLKRVIPLRILVGLDAILQPMGNIYPISPSVFVRSEAVGQDEPNPTGKFWRCPTCHGVDLTEQPSELYCPNCHAHWPVENGIYDFRPAAESSKRVSVKEIRGW